MVTANEAAPRCAWKALPRSSDCGYWPPASMMVRCLPYRTLRARLLRCCLPGRTVGTGLQPVDGAVPPYRTLRARLLRCCLPGRTCPATQMLPSRQDEFRLLRYSLPGRTCSGYLGTAFQAGRDVLTAMVALGFFELQMDSAGGRLENLVAICPYHSKGYRVGCIIVHQQGLAS